MNQENRDRPVGKRKPGMTASHHSILDQHEDEEEDIGPNRRLFLARPTWKVAPAGISKTRNQDWNRPQSNIWKTLATFWSFFVMGANDSASGSLVPYLQSYYGLSYIAVSVIFLSPLAGYVVAGVVDTKIYLTMGRRGVAIISPFCHILAYAVNCFHPPYPVLVITLAFAGLANGLADSAWNSWTSNMDHASQLLGFLHAAFGLGAVMSPLVVSSLTTQAGVQWYYFYYVMTGCAFIELITSLPAFWDLTGPGAYYAQAGDLKKSINHTNSGLRETMFKIPSAARVSWISSIFLFIYAGLELSLSGWIVTFMIDARKAGQFASGLTATWFWLGLTIGRMILGFVTPFYHGP
ncbi:major facilitator superfamily domain-containing protein [Aspergillus avenaceus]|uniref:Major facilitator superfamily domain-containing protein n=1 Tax=Aspergillus avenaceus TaxID=36643 RepID=A0A5N6U8P8_ASPAV|nr:major facilitator superfamily domain-containing protein [Aspergillus avenaceus]